jgi:hypothetical protein
MGLRRAVLKSIGLIGLAARFALPAPRLQARADPPGPAFRRWNGEPLARITQPYQEAYSEPTTGSRMTYILRYDDVIRVRKVVAGQRFRPNNDQWLETKHGYVYASLVQPVGWHIPAIPQADLGAGRWAELIVPYSDSLWYLVRSERRAFAGRVYYGSIHRVTELAADVEGTAYYRVEELYQSVFIRAAHLRLIPDEDLAPISPEVAPHDRHIEVDLAAQRLTALERGAPVWAHPIASGGPGHETPTGTFGVFQKRVSSRLLASTTPDDPAYYNLPGTPFVAYFESENWVAAHGTLWHNDYGRAVSHGCLNLPPGAARWLWRWMTPIAEPGAFFTNASEENRGTVIYIA